MSTDTAGPTGLQPPLKPPKPDFSSLPSPPSSASAEEARTPNDANPLRLTDLPGPPVAAVSAPRGRRRTLSGALATTMATTMSTTMASSARRDGKRSSLWDKSAVSAVLRGSVGSPDGDSPAGGSPAGGSPDGLRKSKSVEEPAAIAPQLRATASDPSVATMFESDRESDRASLLAAAASRQAASAEVTAAFYRGMHPLDTEPPQPPPPGRKRPVLADDDEQAASL